MNKGDTLKFSPRRTTESEWHRVESVKNEAETVKDSSPVKNKLRNGVYLYIKNVLIKKLSTPRSKFCYTFIYSDLVLLRYPAIIYKASNYESPKAPKQEVIFIKLTVYFKLKFIAIESEKCQ